MKLSKNQRDNLGKFFLDIAKIFATIYVIAGYLEKVSLLDFISGLIFTPLESPAA